MIIPLKVDVPMSRMPFVNYALIGVITIFSMAALNDEDTFMRYSGVGGVRIGGIDPDQIEDLTPKQIERMVDSGQLRVEPTVSTTEFPLPVLAVTSTFLHADWLHLIGNMLFLWIFGNAINYKLGHPLFLGLYLLCGFAGSMAHYLFDGGPVVGASGAINGMMGAFLVFFPLNNVKVFYWIWMKVGTFDMAGIWFMILFVGWDVLWLVSGAETSTALWGHVGGFAVGFGIALILLLTGAVKPSSDERSLLYMLGRE